MWDESFEVSPDNGKVFRGNAIKKILLLSNAGVPGELGMGPAEKLRSRLVDREARWGDLDQSRCENLVDYRNWEYMVKILSCPKVQIRGPRRWRTLGLPMRGIFKDRLHEVVSNFGETWLTFSTE